MSRSNTNLHQGPTDSMVMVRHQTLHVLQGINKMTSPSVRKESRDLPCPNCGSGQRMQPKIRCCAGSAGPLPRQPSRNSGVFHPFDKCQNWSLENMTICFLLSIRSI